MQERLCSLSGVGKSWGSPGGTTIAGRVDPVPYKQQKRMDGLSDVPADPLPADIRLAGIFC